MLYQRGFKRIIDLVFVTVGLVILSPLMLVIALLVVADSSRPIFYRGVRTGLNGIPFKIFKFRSMVPEAEQLGGLSTAKDDKRLTRVGRWLRKYKLDEMPQLLNVLKGEMSIVGPRPEMPEYTRLYSGEEKLILTVHPGITDLASLEFFRLSETLGEENPDEIYENQIRPIKNKLRVKYVKEQSFSGDMRIILQTMIKMVRG